ncbi:MAG: DUF4194 domain-containing protein [Desulfotignum sp.]|nr:DUF4194 domain-containing protein [Desulfotignum sp.]MCF8113122.1 DUF4194 domain-containing protein [Desulfotignum sp.]MCF8125385.1 DUF4194 domain-containing protein [Desulfotignum sp.]
MDATQPYPSDISRPLVALMKGVVFKENDPALWHLLEEGQMAVRDYVRVMGLELMLDTAEGHAWLATREPEEGEDPLPRLVGRRQLSYPVSLIIALLRKKMAEQDAAGEDPRLILSVEEITDMVRVFLPASGNEARMMDRINTHLNKIADLGFIRRLKGEKDKIEVIRILKAFVDAQWLSELDDRLREYQDRLEDDSETGPAGDSDIETDTGSNRTGNKGEG